MSESGWPIRLVSSGGMRITLTANPESVHVRIVSSSPSTPSTIVETRGMRVYVINPEALPYEYRERNVPRRSTTSSGGHLQCPHCGKSGPDWVKAKFAIVYPKTGRSQPLFSGIAAIALMLCIGVGGLAAGASAAWPTPVSILCFLLGVFFLISVVRTPKGMSYYCTNCREKWAIPFKEKTDQ